MDRRKFLAMLGVAPVALKVASDPPAPTPLSFIDTSLTQEDDDVRYIIKGGSSSLWYISDGIVARSVTTVEAEQLVFVGQARWNNGSPYVYPQSLVNSMTKMPRDRLIS